MREAADIDLGLVFAVEQALDALARAESLYVAHGPGPVLTPINKFSKHDAQIAMPDVRQDGSHQPLEGWLMTLQDLRKVATRECQHAGDVQATILDLTIGENAPNMLVGIPGGAADIEKASEGLHSAPIGIGVITMRAAPSNVLMPATMHEPRERKPVK